MADGVDVVYTVYPLKLTMEGRAFCLRPPMNLLERSQCVRQYGSAVASSEKETVTLGEKRPREEMVSSEVTDDSSNAAKRVKAEESSGEAFTMDLWNPVFERDPRPLVENCQCIACQRHTRAYIHHLLKSRELLAEVLLYQHNQWQLLATFKEIREHIRVGDFPQWKLDLIDTWTSK